MRIGLFSLRAEYRVSGERNSTLALVACLESLGAEVVDHTFTNAASSFGIGNLVDWTHAKKLREAMRREAFSYYFVKIATVAQLPLVRLLSEGRQAERIVVLLDSVCSDRANLGSFWRELRHEPAYALGKRFMNHRFWARLGRFEPRACIGCATTQLEEARRALGTSTEFRVIPNASPPARELPISPKPGGPVVIGYLGPPRAYKGCIEVIESAAYLWGDSPKFVFRAAFNLAGSAAIRRRWRAGGGEETGIVDPDAFIRSVDILCVPLYTEFGTKVFPNILLEAARAGVPVITSNLPVFVELLGDKGPLPYLPRVTGEEIAKAIRLILTQDRLALAAYLRSRHALVSPPVIQNRWREFLRSLEHEA